MSKAADHILEKVRETRLKGGQKRIHTLYWTNISISLKFELTGYILGNHPLQEGASRCSALQPQKESKSWDDGRK